MAIPAIGSQGYNGYYVNQAPVADEGRTSAAVSTSAPSFRSQPERDTVELSNKKEKKKSNAAAWGILGTVATIGAAILCKKAYNIGKSPDMTWYGRVNDGLKQYFNKSTKAIGKWTVNAKTSEELAKSPWYQRWWHSAKRGWNNCVNTVGKWNLKTNKPTYSQQEVEAWHACCA